MRSRLQNREYAKKNLEYVNTYYSDEVLHSRKMTRVYDSHAEFNNVKLNPKLSIRLVAKDTVSALFEDITEQDGHVGILNFASYKNPGGGYLNGSYAQEEALCHVSTLYSVLCTQTRFYSVNQHHLNCSLYTNRALYSPDIVFFSEDYDKYADVITCAAPNRKAALKKGVSEAENETALKSRIEFIYNIANENQIDTLILGAYGCGVFGQNPKKVADLFLEYAKGKVKTIIFAVPQGKNYESFVEALSYD